MNTETHTHVREQVHSHTFTSTHKYKYVHTYMYTNSPHLTRMCTQACMCVHKPEKQAHVGAGVCVHV